MRSAAKAYAAASSSSTTPRDFAVRCSAQAISFRAMSRVTTIATATLPRCQTGFKRPDRRHFPHKHEVTWPARACCVDGLVPGQISRLATGAGMTHSSQCQNAAMTVLASGIPTHRRFIAIRWCNNGKSRRVCARRIGCGDGCRLLLCGSGACAGTSRRPRLLHRNLAEGTSPGRTLRRLGRLARTAGRRLSAWCSDAASCRLIREVSSRQA